MNVLIVDCVRIAFCVAIRDTINYNQMALFGSVDIDKVVRCPYNKDHVMKYSKLGIHLAKCEKKSPIKLQVCVFNSLHRIPQHEYDRHLIVCPNATQFARKCITQCGLKAVGKD